MSDDKVFDVHAILEPSKEATPQGELRNFIERLDEQLPPGSDPHSMVIFGAPRSALIRIRAAMECGIDALNVQGAVKEAN